MFSKTDIEYLRQQPYKIILLNYHDVAIHSDRTGHDWTIVSNYEGPDCYILHRHSRKVPFHRQEGRYKDLREALDYINLHEEWFVKNKMN